MNAQLRRLDEKGEILANDRRNGKITQDVFAKRLRKLVERAEVLMARAAK